MPRWYWWGQLVLAAAFLGKAVADGSAAFIALWIVVIVGTLAMIVKEVYASRS